MAKPQPPDPIKSATIAGSAVAMALIDVLIADKILTADRALALLADAQRRLQTKVGNDPDVRQAGLLIGALYERISKS